MSEHLRVFGSFVRALVLSSGVFAISPAQAALEVGIDRSNLSLLSQGEREKALSDIRGLHATWFRDGQKGASAQNLANFVDEMRFAKQLGLKILMIVGPHEEDFDGELESNRCKWKATKLSEINLEKLQERLTNLFGALKSAGVEIDAVEFGNELDHDCYDADVPSGRVATQEDVTTWLRGYAHFLKTGAQLLHDPRFFPRAKIITFGIAHGSDKWDYPPHHLNNPAHLIAMLRNVDGFNYLDNSVYHVDGYGTHIYPPPNEIAQSITETLQEDVAALGRDKPFWVTEWGFLNIKQFPNKAGQSLSQALEECFETFAKLARDIPLGPLMFYSYNVWLTDDSGHLLPQASVISAHGEKGR